MPPCISYLGSTRNSIKISWTNCKFGDEEISYIVQVEDRVYDWITKYWGLETNVEIKNLAPEEIFNIRVGYIIKKEDEWDNDVVWSEIFISATKFDLPWSFYLFQDIERASVENIVNFIQERNCSLDVLNRQGETPLNKAIRLKNEIAVKLLVNGGSDIDEQSWPSFRSPLMIASFYGNLDAAIILVLKGANIFLKDVNRMDALHYAVEGSQIDLVRYLLECGAFIDSKDNFGWTPLMRGIIMDVDFEILSFLIHNGADPQIQDKWNRNSLKMSKILGNHQMNKLFIGIDEYNKKDEMLNKPEEGQSEDESEPDILAEHAQVIKWILEENENTEEDIVLK